jgi:hypothetical protein
MSQPLNTPLGRFGIVTSEEGPQRCTASIPAGGMTNPPSGQPTVAALAMLVDHVGGLVNHHPRGPSEWTVSSELSLEVAPNALGSVIATATVRSFYVQAPGHLAKWPTGPTRALPPGSLAERMSVPVAESGGAAKVLVQDPDPVLNNSLGIVHGGAPALELVGADGKAAIIARVTAYC